MHVMSEFWDRAHSGNGGVPGYSGNSDASASTDDGTDGTSDAVQTLLDGTDSSDGSGDYSDVMVQTMEVMMMEVRMTEVMMMGVQMIRKITAMILVDYGDGTE